MFLTTAGKNAQKVLSSRRLTQAVLVWSALQGIFFALALFYAPGISVPPDEIFHFNFAKYYADNSWWPILTEQPGFEGDWRDITRPPQYLYHYLASFVIRFQGLVGLGDSVIPLRLISVALSTWNIWLIHKLAKRLGLSNALANLTILIISNLMMWSVLSASVTYDVTTNVIATVLLIGLVDSFNELPFKRLLGLLALSALSLLVKFSILPLLVGIWITLLIRHYRSIGSLANSIFRSLKSLDKTTWALGLLLLLGLVMVSERYVQNTIEFGSFRPSCDAVHSDEICQQSALYRRNSAFVAVTPENDIAVPRFTYDWWNKNHDRTVGTLTHIQSTKTFDSVRVATLVLSWVAVGSLLAIALRRTNWRGPRLSLLVILGFYTFSLLIVNYVLFQRSGQFGLALQGRYLFPVLPLLVILPLTLMAEASKNQDRFVRYIGFPIALTFFLSGLPAHIVKADERLYNTEYREPVSEVQDLLIDISNP